MVEERRLYDKLRFRSTGGNVATFGKVPIKPLPDMWRVLSSCISKRQDGIVPERNVFVYVPTSGTTGMRQLSPAERPSMANVVNPLLALHICGGIEPRKQLPTRMISRIRGRENMEEGTVPENLWEFEMN